MNKVDELLKSVITVADGLTIIANLENNRDKSGKSLGEGMSESRVLLEDFKEAFYKSEVISLTLAINPTAEFLIKLQGWFMDNLAKRIIFDLKVDPLIVGGAKIICRDHFRDFSLAESVDAAIKNGVDLNHEEANLMPTTSI